MTEKRIVVLTGAGISAESGIATFRASDGLWENHRVEDVATPEGFARNPKLVQDFYNARRARLHDADVQPNAAHIALARLQQALPGKVTLITQNVDDLHERGGATEVLHMHGSLLSVRCLYCDSVQDNWHDDCSTETVCPVCKRAHGMRPDIVWFGEMPYYMNIIESASPIAPTSPPLAHRGRFTRQPASSPSRASGGQRRMKSTWNPVTAPVNSSIYTVARRRSRSRAGWKAC